MLGWILLAMSAAFATPIPVLEAETLLPADKASTSLDPFFSFRGMNPLTWMPSFSILTRDYGPSNPVTYLDPIELAEHYGYAAERHTVTTEEGYILELHRLPSARRKPEDKNNKDKVPRPVALLHHAFLTSSREFLLLGPEKALAFILADAGYDVWLCNARGNTFSRKHTALQPSQREFWNFSYHEHGTQDLPAAINYVLKVSGSSKLHYLGHSMGTTAFLIMLSERSEMLNKIKTFSGMGPVASTANCRSGMLRFVLGATRYVVTIMERTGMYELLPHFRWFTLAGQAICKNEYTRPFCTAFLSALAGKSTSIDTNILPEMLAHTPAGSSIKCLAHFAQNYYTGFRKFDYGEKENLLRYNSTTPPFYNLKAANIPTQLFYGMNDLMADYTEALYLCKELPNVFKCERVPDDTFTHLDFIWSDKARILLYPSIIEGMKKFEDFSEEESS